MLQTEINKKNTEIKVLLNTQNLNWPFFKTTYRKLNIIGINNHSKVFKANKNNIQKAGSGYLCCSWLHNKVRLKVRHQDLGNLANMCSSSCKIALSSARWRSNKSWIAQLCMLQNQWQCLASKFLFPSCMFVCFHVKLFLLGCMSWYANTINRSKYQPACSAGTSHLSGCAIPYCQVRHSWSSCLILCSCSLHASNSHWQKMQTIQILHFTMLQLNGRLESTHQSLTKSKFLPPFCAQLSRQHKDCLYQRRHKLQKSCCCTKKSCLQMFFRKRSYKGREGGNTSHVLLSSSEILLSQKNLKSLKC